jgi:hypothetical protein
MLVNKRRFSRTLRSMLSGEGFDHGNKLSRRAYVAIIRFHMLSERAMVK